MPTRWSKISTCQGSVGINSIMISYSIHSTRWRRREGEIGRGCLQLDQASRRIPEAGSRRIRAQQQWWRRRRRRPVSSLRSRPLPLGGRKSSSEYKFTGDLSDWSWKYTFCQNICTRRPFRKWVHLNGSNSSICIIAARCTWGKYDLCCNFESPTISSQPFFSRGTNILLGPVCIIYWQWINVPQRPGTRFRNTSCPRTIHYPA